MGYDTGLDALQRTINESKSRGGGNAKNNYITWKDNETKIVRFLTNEVISGLFAEWVLVNNPKVGTQDFMVDESKGNFVEKYGGLTKDRQSGALVPPKLQKKGAAIAVLRDEVPDPANPGRMHVIDKIERKNVEGPDLPARYFGIIKQGIRNFWTPLLGAAERYDGICDRDWAIKRIGASTDTIYIPSPIEPTPDTDSLRDLNVLQQFYGYGKPFDEEDPQRFLFCPQTLIEWADYYSGEDRAKFWLTPKQPEATTSPAWGQPAAGGYATIAGFAPPQAPVQPSYALPPQQVIQPPQPPQFTPPAPPQVQPAAGYGEFHPATTQNPVAPPAAAPVPQSAQQGPWGGNEDEAQAAPSMDTSWATLQSQLMPHLTAPAEQTAPAPQ